MNDKIIGNANHGDVRDEPKVRVDSWRLGSDILARCDWLLPLPNLIA